MPARVRHALIIISLAVAITSLLVPNPLIAQAPSQEARLETPRSIRDVHEGLHSALIEATKMPGRIGTTSRALEALLEPHWVREEQMAMPPLGLLAPLAAGARIADADATAARSMSDTLRREMPAMLTEHKQNRASIDAFRQAAVAERSVKFQQLADALTQHAQSEEDVFYPAAVLVGDLLRAKQAGGR